MYYLLKLVFLTCEMYVVQHFFFFFQCVFKHLFFTHVSYFQDSYSGGPSLLSGSWAAYRGCSSVWFTEVWASCLHCDLCLTQTLLKSLVRLQGSKSDKKNWVYV